MTLEKAIVGTPNYISPEAVTDGSKVDKRADFYSLGVIGYEIAFGTKPYNGKCAKFCAVMSAAMPIGRYLPLAKSINVPQTD